MNENTMNTLGYHQIQNNVASCTLSYLGKRYAKEMKPMVDPGLIQMRLAETEEASALIRYGASVPIPSLDGMETIMDLLGTGYLFSERDFTQLAQFLRSCAQLMKYMEGKSEAAPTVSRYASSMMRMESLLSEIERCIYSGRIQDQASKERHVSGKDDCERGTNEAQAGFSCEQAPVHYAGERNQPARRKNGITHQERIPQAGERQCPG